MNLTPTSRTRPSSTAITGLTSSRPPNTMRRLRNWFNKIVMQADGDDAKKELDALSKYAQNMGDSNE